MVNGFVARFMNTANGILEKRAFGAITAVAAAQQPTALGIRRVPCRA